MSSDNQPAFRVYSVIPREGKDDYWLNIGLALPLHEPVVATADASQR